MPFTPFHMGVALLIKPAAPRLSVVSFGLSQVLIDIEPGLGLLLNWSVLHGYSHTLVGAIVIALLASALSPGLIAVLTTRWNQEVVHYGWPWLLVSTVAPSSVRLTCAMLGTFSHLVLDGLIHTDMHPWWPLTNRNPLMGTVPHDLVYLGCGIALLVGSAVWLLLQWRYSRR